MKRAYKNFEMFSEPDSLDNFIDLTRLVSTVEDTMDMFTVYSNCYSERDLNEYFFFYTVLKDKAVERVVYVDGFGKFLADRLSKIQNKETMEDFLKSKNVDQIRKAKTQLKFKKEMGIIDEEKTTKLIKDIRIDEEAIAFIKTNIKIFSTKELKLLAYVFGIRGTIFSEDVSDNKPILLKELVKTVGNMILIIETKNHSGQ